jgi:hypothetical protein
MVVVSKLLYRSGGVLKGALVFIIFQTTHTSTHITPYINRATPSLRSLIRATQANVSHPQGGVISNHTAEDEIAILGSGSDYTVSYGVCVCVPAKCKEDGHLNVISLVHDPTRLLLLQVFIHHLGITSLDTASVIDPMAQYGMYHSIYDSFQ